MSTATARLLPHSSRQFRDDEEVFTAFSTILPGVPVPVFGQTDRWLADCLRRPSNRIRGEWRLLFPTRDPVWNLRAREVSFVHCNPAHAAVRAAGIDLPAEPDSLGTSRHTLNKLNGLRRWALKRQMPENLGLWEPDDWQDFIDATAERVGPQTLPGYVVALRRLQRFAPVLTHGGMREDPWPGVPATRVTARPAGIDQLVITAADLRADGEVTTPSVPPATWWPLLRAAWTYIHSFAPDIFEARARAQQVPAGPRETTTQKSRSSISRNADYDRKLRQWLADPANLVPVRDRPSNGFPTGSALWCSLSLMITDGANNMIFLGTSALGRARRDLVQPALDAGRTRAVNPRNAAKELGVARQQPRHKYRSTAELSDTLAMWLADPNNLVPIREHDTSEGPAGSPIVKVLARVIYDLNDTGVFMAKTPTAQHRLRMVEAAVAAGQVVRVSGEGTGRDVPIAGVEFSLITRPDGSCEPWRSGITMANLDYELRMLRAACYVFIGALSMMRDSEIQEIERGALATYYGSPAIRSRKIKHDKNQPEKHWWIIEPVAQALAVAEQLSWHDTHVFATIRGSQADLPSRDPAHLQAGRRGIHADQAIDFFIAGINANHERLGLEPIAPAAVRPHMLRKTMAVITGQEPDAEIALGLQLKHAARRALANRVTLGYARADKDWIKEFDRQLEFAAAQKLVALLKARRSGEDVAVGPGAARLHAGLDKVIAAMDNDPQLRAQLADERVQTILLHNEFPELHLGTLNHCMWDAKQAECQNALPEDQRGQSPLIGACEPARCRNSVITRAHAPIWLAEENDLTEMAKNRRLAPPRREAVLIRLSDVQRITHALNDETDND
ncbi:hypothetical protein [Kitasatospora sp. NPDC088134]|uniref:hypothetical protein n=1 Tax=Kitasatospora sp. NPDC088134 TaxID=3364071 RepID=UPI003823C843